MMQARRRLTSSSVICVDLYRYANQSKEFETMEPTVNSDSPARQSRRRHQPSKLSSSGPGSRRSERLDLWKRRRLGMGLALGETIHRSSPLDCHRRCHTGSRPGPCLGACRRISCGAGCRRSRPLGYGLLFFIATTRLGLLPLKLAPLLFHLTTLRVHLLAVPPISCCLIRASAPATTAHD